MSRSLSQKGIRLWKKCVVFSFAFALILILTVQVSSQINPTQLWHEDVDAIVLMDEREFKIKSKNKAEYKIHQVIRINNGRGRKYGEVLIHENKFIKCSKISGKILDLDSMISESMNDREKIQRLYSFLQNHTRYVAIELGLSNWQPQSAQSVFDNHYGDCKDLTTLMVAMLREVGVKAYPASILTRDHGLLIKEFPANQFNHF